MLGHQRVQLGHAAETVGDAARSEHRALLVKQAHVMVALGPVHPYEQHRNLLRVELLFGEPEKDRGALMVVLVARHPTSRLAFPLTSRGTLSPKGSEDPGSISSAHPLAAPPKPR